VGAMAAQWGVSRDGDAAGTTVWFDLAHTRAAPRSSP